MEDRFAALQEPGLPALLVVAALALVAQIAPDSAAP